MSDLSNQMESLLCMETTEQPRGIEDPVLSHVDVGTNMLRLQLTTTPRVDYFLLQDQLNPSMRRIVGIWMNQVCIDSKCEDTIFPLAMNYMDRFLCIMPINKNQIQLVGAVCMLIASKLRESSQMSPELLSVYTACSVSPEEILQWELLVVSKLRWDLSPPIPNDFVDHFLLRIGIPLSKSSPIRVRTLSYVDLAIIDYASIQMKPSLIAAGALGAAYRSLHYMFPSEMLADFIEEDALYVEQAIEYITQVFEDEQKSIDDSPESPSPSPVPEEYIPSFKNEVEESDNYDGNETPTDVSDVHF